MNLKSVNTHDLYFKGVTLKYGVPIGVPLKIYTPEQITVKELKADICR